MTKARLRLNIAIVVFAFTALVAALAAARFWFRDENLYGFLKDATAPYIAIGAAYLAYCLQSRQGFLAMLRDLWREAIEAKLAMYRFLGSDTPTQEGYAAAFSALSKAMDAVRCVYLNVGESHTRLGYYPFQPMHDMRKALESMNPLSNPSEADRQEQRQIIDRAWNAFRWAFLQEFPRVRASDAIVERHVIDPRRAISR